MDVLKRSGETQIDYWAKRMLTATETPAQNLATAVQMWLEQFQQALAADDPVRLTSLFHADCYWRDVLALTWRITTISGADAVIGELRARAGAARPTDFAIDQDRTAPRRVTRAGTDAIEAIFKFDTKDGRGSGLLRLTPDARDGGKLKGWTLL